MQVAVVDIGVGVPLVLYRPFQEDLYLQDDLRADVAHLEFEYPALGSESCDHGMNLACEEADDIGIHHRGVQGLVNVPSRFKGRAQKAA